MDVWEINEQVQAHKKTFLSRTGSGFEFPSVEFVTFSVGLSKKKIDKCLQIPPAEKKSKLLKSSGKLNLRFF